MGGSDVFFCFYRLGAISPFFFRHRKKNQERCHRFGAVDADQRNLSSGLQPKKTARPSILPRVLGPTLRAEGTCPVPAAKLLREKGNFAAGFAFLNRQQTANQQNLAVRYSTKAR